MRDRHLMGSAPIYSWIDLFAPIDSLPVGILSYLISASLVRIGHTSKWVKLWTNFQSWLTPDAGTRCQRAGWRTRTRKKRTRKPQPRMRRKRTIRRRPRPWPSGAEIECSPRDRRSSKTARRKKSWSVILYYVNDGQDNFLIALQLLDPIYIFLVLVEKKDLAVF